MKTFYFVVRKHNSFNGKNRKRVFSDQDFQRAWIHYLKLTRMKDLDRVSLNLRCGMTQPYDEVALLEHRK